MAGSVKHLGEFGYHPSGQAIDRYQLDNGKGLCAEVLTLGGNVLRLQAPDRNGQSGDICLGLPSIETLLSPKSNYIGSLIGRYGNRIKAGQFSIDGKTYQLAINNGPNSLHGGLIGYDKRIWTASPIQSSDGAALKLSLEDTDGTENYPGTVKVDVIYTLTDSSAWRIEYTATADKATPINLTHHAYFNLKDAGKTSILDHQLKLNCSSYTPSDAELIPTGHLTKVDATPFDFRKLKPIGRDFSRLAGDPLGYDHNFIIDGSAGELREAAEVYEPTTGRVMNVFTTEPAVQFYSGNFLNGTLNGNEGVVYQQYTGFCLETQHYPDSPNQSSFPSTILLPGQIYKHVTEYRFSVR